jgi:hypothetical protein
MPDPTKKSRCIAKAKTYSTFGPDKYYRCRSHFFPMEPGENLAMPDTDPANTPESLIQIKLRDTFFYQHRDIKEICNFTVSCVFKTFEEELVQECFKPLIRFGGSM